MKRNPITRKKCLMDTGDLEQEPNKMENLYSLTYRGRDLAEKLLSKSIRLSRAEDH